MRAPDATSGSAVPTRGCLLGLEEVRRLHAAALEVLADVGVAIAPGRVRGALRARGASVSGDAVRFPSHVVRDLMHSVPSQFALGARAAATLKTGERPLLTTDGCCVEIYDLETAVRRPTVAGDVASIARLADAVGDIDFCWPAVSALDRPAETRGLYELYEAIANTGKHVQTVTIVEPRLAEQAVAMARVLAGSEQRLRAEPPISALLGTVTPLATDAGSLEAALVFASAGIPVGFVSMPMGGSTTPITMAGSLVVAIAELLASTCCVQAIFPGAPVFMCFIPSVMDLKTGDFTGGAPEDTLMGAAAGDIGRFYRIPTQCGINSSGGKVPGWQSALDDATTTLLSLCCGVDMLTGVGMLAGGRVFSYEEMLLAAGTMARARALLKGRALLAADAVAGQGERERADGTGPSLDRSVGVAEANLEARRLLAEHRPIPLLPSVDGELRRIIGD
ncbi:MAG: trimethylamine methyltransferase family protein [Thermoleophilia bacterium]